jgi:hypothetical protein
VCTFGVFAPIDDETGAGKLVRLAGQRVACHEGKDSEVERAPLGMRTVDVVLDDSPILDAIEQQDEAPLPELAGDLVENAGGSRPSARRQSAERRGERRSGIVKDVRGSESNCEHDSRKM